MLLFGIPATRAPAPTGFLLLEDGGYLLNENGGRISLNESNLPPIHGLQWQKVYEQPLTSGLGGTIRPTFNDIKYADGRYFAVGSSAVTNKPYAITSTDAVIWTEVAPVIPAEYPVGVTKFSSVLYSTVLEKWILVAPHSAATRLYLSSDLVSWSAIDALLPNIAQLQYNGVSYVARTEGNIFSVSTNLTTWVDCLFNGAYFRASGLTQDSGVFFSSNTYQGSSRNLYSYDGATWQEFGTSLVLGPQILRGRGRWWATRGFNAPYYSSDLITWTQVTLSGPMTVTQIGYTDNTWLIGGFVPGQGIRIALSQDGINFQVLQSANFPTTSPTTIIGANGKFLWHSFNVSYVYMHLSA